MTPTKIKRRGFLGGLAAVVVAPLSWFGWKRSRVADVVVPSSSHSRAGRSEVRVTILPFDPRDVYFVPAKRFLRSRKPIFSVRWEQLDPDAEVRHVLTFKPEAVRAMVTRNPDVDTDSLPGRVFWQAYSNGKWSFVTDMAMDGAPLVITHPRYRNHGGIKP